MYCAITVVNNCFPTLHDQERNILCQDTVSMIYKSNEYNLIQILKSFQLNKENGIRRIVLGK